MSFWLKLFYLTLVLDNGIMEIPKFEFDYITSGHSGFLITWKRQPLIRYFLFASRIKDAIDDDFSVSKIYEDSETDFYKIYSLKESTLYEIILYQYSNKSKLQSDHVPLSQWETNYTLELRTNGKTNIKPAKPDFRISQIRKGNTFTLLASLWVLNERGEYRFEEYENDRILIEFIPGKPYEVTFVSINGDYETESDPQEIYVEPRFTTVTSLTAISFPNASILVSWKPPKYALETLTNYTVGIANESLTYDNQSRILSHTKGFTVKSYFATTNTTEKLFDKPEHQLKLGDTYIISIIPRGRTGAGLEVGKNAVIYGRADNILGL